MSPCPDYSNPAIGFASMRQSTEVTSRPIMENECFPVQWEVMHDDRVVQVWDCSRRAAKTATAIRRTVKRSAERPGWRTLYIHRTRALANQQFFETGEKDGPGANPGVRELMKSHGMQEDDRDLTELWVRFTNGSLVQVVGCDDIRSVDKQLGFRWNDILIDECQNHNEVLLKRLVVKTILPTLIDRRGTLTLMGTPAEIEAGTWYDMKTDPQLKGDGYHHWTLFDNPFIDPANITPIYEKMGYKIDFSNPRNNDVVVQREIFGLQVIDATKLRYNYDPAKNDWPVAGVPLVDSTAWCYAMGIDIGGVEDDNDEDAVVVLGWLRNDPEHLLWERESWTGRGDSEEFCDRIEATYKRWSPMMSVVGDTGGAGATKALASFAKRINGLKLAGKPTSVETSTRLLNDEFRSGRFRVNPLGKIAKGAKMCLKDQHEVDVMAACRYAHHGAYHFLAKPKPKEEEKSLDELIKEARWAQRSKENRELSDPWKQMGGWSG